MAEPNETSKFGGDDSMRIAVLGHLLRKERDQSAGSLEELASLLESSVPDRVVVERSGWPWSKIKPVVKIDIQFPDVGFDITRVKNRAPVVRRHHISRGISLKSSEVAMAECIETIVDKLIELEKQSSSTRLALDKFVNGR
jgi:hypothetical protein